MVVRWLILADDLTGAADCAIAFARNGHTAYVGWGEAGGAEAGTVLAIDADSRRLPPQAAAARHRALLAAHHAPGLRLIKKLDSTLRGQPAAELHATVELLRSRGAGAMALVAPAFPATGRTTEGGRIRLEGQPLERTTLWARDHSYPSADLVAVLRDAGLRTGLLPLAVLRDPAAQTRALHAALTERLEALVCDAVTAEDLHALARASLPLAERLFWAGSGGIAAALAAADGNGEATPWVPLACAPGGILVVVGSVAEASHAAAARAVALGRVRPFGIPASALLAGGATEGAAIAAALAAGEDVLVTLEAEGAPDLSRGALLAMRLAEMLAPAAPHIAGLFATGGETACALLSRLGIHGIRLLEEAEPGVPLGMTLGAHAFPVMTKAGAFGTADTIARSLARLRVLLRKDSP